VREMYGYFGMEYFFEENRVLSNAIFKIFYLLASFINTADDLNALIYDIEHPWNNDVTTGLLGICLR